MLSVIITTYNRSKILAERALPSVLGQTLRDLECIIVDGGSTDDTETVVREFAKKDPRVKYFKTENHGLSGARNFGLRQATGEYVAFTDDDDKYLPDYLEAGLRAFKSLPAEVGFLSGGFFITDDHGIVTYLPVPVEPFWRCPVGNGWMFRRKCFFEHDIFFDENLRGFEDLDIRIRLNEYYKGFAIDRPTRQYYLNLKQEQQRTISLSASIMHQRENSEKFWAKNEVRYRSYGSAAVAYILLFLGLTNARAGSMRRGRMFLQQSLAAQFDQNTLLYLCFAFFGHGVFAWYDNFKNRTMRIIRHWFIDPVPQGWAPER